MFREILIKFDYYFKANSPNPFIVDCGSNVGLSLLFFKILYPECRVIAFEPDNDNFRVLSDNVSNNNLKDIQLNNKALGSDRGTKKFYYNPSKPGMGRASIIERDFLPKYKEVDVVLLSDYIDRRIDFLKMDIEGAETSVIRDLSENKKIELINEMVIEYHHHIIKGIDNLSEMLSILELNNFGYQINAPFRGGYDYRNKFQDMLIYAYRK